MASHRINLRGPWDFKFQCHASDDIRSGTVAMPQEWRSLFGINSGFAVFRRKFHRPTNLDAHERVAIILTEVCGHGVTRLNDVVLNSFHSAGAAVEFDITNGMNAFNELAIEIAFDPKGLAKPFGGLYGVVAIEIRSE